MKHNIQKRGGNFMKSKKKIIGIVLLSIICILILAIGIYLGNYSHSDPMVEEYLVSNDSVKVEQIDNYYYFDGPGEGTAINFYPGAKVEAKSYAPLLHGLAEQGIDCFLVKMPFNMALLNSNAAEKIINNYNYENWYISGHSMGGVAATNYVIKNEDKVTGVILLASYPTKKIPDSVKLLSVYGSLDGVLNRENYNNGKQFWSKNSKEFEITGGNHAQFGNYGEQKNDKKADISAEEQQEQTIRSIVGFINEK